MTSISVSTRVAGRTLAGTVAEFDRLVSALVDRCGTTEPPKWELGHPKFRGLRVTGALADVDSIDLTRVRSATVWIGSPIADRRITLTADWLGHRADVWGEDPEWSSDTAAIVRRRLAELKPWWAFWRNFWGGWILAAVGGALGVVGVVLYGLVTRTVPAQPVVWTAMIVGVLAGVAASTWLAPSLRIGPRASTRAVVGRVVGWVTLTLVTSVIGAVIAVPVTAMLT